MINNINKIYDKNVKISISSGRKVILKESNPKAKLKEIQFQLCKRHLNGTYIKDSCIVELDKNNKPFDKITYFFNNYPGINKKSDFIIYHQTDSYLAVIICDMKSSPIGATCTDSQTQFKNSFLFTEYVKTVYNLFFNKHNNIKVFLIAFMQLEGLSPSIEIGTVNHKKLKEIKSTNISPNDINLESLSINSSGVANMHWEELIKRLP